jgi:hypothetical protein
MQLIARYKVKREIENLGRWLYPPRSGGKQHETNRSDGPGGRRNHRCGEVIERPEVFLDGENGVFVLLHEGEGRTEPALHAGEPGHQRVLL